MRSDDVLDSECESSSLMMVLWGATSTVSTGDEFACGAGSVPESGIVLDSFDSVCVEASTDAVSFVVLSCSSADLVCSADVSVMLADSRLLFDAVVGVADFPWAAWA